MNWGFSEDEYSRVRDWLVAALVLSPDVFSEAEMLENLRSNEWHLLTTENAACVLQLCEIDGERIANVLAIGGKIGGSLREIMKAHTVVCDFLRAQNFTQLVGEPRAEWAAILNRNGFRQKGSEYIKELN